MELEALTAQQQRVPVDGRLRADNALVLRAAVLGDAGIACLASYIVGPDLRAGRLQAVLPDYPPVAAVIRVVYPQNRHLSPKVRALIEFLVERFQPNPFWDAGWEKT